MSKQQTWGGRFRQGPAALVQEYTDSVSYDNALYAQDIAGSKAHARMLARQGVLTAHEAQTLVTGLEAVQAEIEAGTFTWMIKKRINAHQEWFDDNNDEDWGFEDNYPHLLLVCDNKSTEKRIHRLTDEAYMDYETWTTTRERFNTGEKRVWLRYYDEDEMELVGL